MHMLLISPKIMVLVQCLILKIYLHIRHQYPFLMTHLLIPLLALPLNIHLTLFHCTLHTHKESIDVILDEQVVLTRERSNASWFPGMVDRSLTALGSPEMIAHLSHEFMGDGGNVGHTQ